VFHVDTLLLGLPTRVLHCIFGHLRLDDVRNVALTCKKLSKSVDHPLVWRFATLNSVDPHEEPIEFTEYFFETVRGYEGNILRCVDRCYE